MPFSVPTSLSKCAFLPVPRSDCWFRYFGHSLSMCCLVWIVRPHPHVGSNSYVSILKMQHSREEILSKMGWVLELRLVLLSL